MELGWAYWWREVYVAVNSGLFPIVSHESKVPMEKKSLSFENQYLKEVLIHHTFWMFDSKPHFVNGLEQKHLF